MGRPTLTKANQKWWGASRPTIFDDFCQGWAAHFQTGLALEGLRYNPRGGGGSNGRYLAGNKKTNTIVAAIWLEA